MRRRLILIVGGVVVLLLVVTVFGALSGGDSSADESGSATPAPVPGAPVTTETPTPDTPVASQTPAPKSLNPTPDADTGVTPGSVAAGDGGLGGGQVRFTVLELRRSGDTVVLNATLTRADAGSGSLRVGSAYSDGSTESGDAPDTLDGITMVDPVGRRRYLVARDAKGACICSTRLRDAMVSRESPVSLQATLTAPPAGVKSIDLSVPGIETFTTVSIEN